MADEPDISAFTITFRGRRVEMHGLARRAKIPVWFQAGYYILF